MTIWLNLGMAGLMYVAVSLFGPQWEWYLSPFSVGVLVYSFAYDWHVDAGAYREALAELEAERRLS